ncbi:MAG: hypothetical protein M3O50_03315 [Myxococcota bacterium]|nr:hypothetical protein [Myxococcota bacterium]
MMKPPPSPSRLRSSLSSLPFVAGALPLCLAPPRAPSLAKAFVGLVACVAIGCADHAKQSAARAAENAADLAALVDTDVSEVERGMPEGASRLAPLVAMGADPRQDVAGVRRSLLRVRREVLELSVAKSTFFALADTSGVAIRNDLEEDVMAGQNLFAVFPALAAAKDRYVTTTGSFPNATSKGGPDEDWIAGVPVKRENGSTGAVFVTGWTYRYFARHLQESLNDRLTEQAKAGRNDGKLPVFYVSVFDRTGVYSAPLTPPIDEAALRDQDLVARTQGASVFQGTITIADRAFGFAAQRTPKLGPDAGIVVLRSDM